MLPRLLLSALLFCASCTLLPRKNVELTAVPKNAAAATETHANEADTASNGLGSSSSTLTKSADQVDSLATAAEIKAPVIAAEASAIRKEAATIKAEAVEVSTVAHDIAALANRLRDTKAKVEQLEAGIATRDASLKVLQDKLKAADDKTQSALRRALVFAMLAGLAAVAVSAMLVVNGNGKAIGIGVGGAALSVAAIGFSVVFAHREAIALVAGVVIVGIVVWKIIEKRRDEKTAFELVKATEKVKKYLPEDKKERLFGDVVGDGEVGQLQSEGTKAKVRKYREKLATAVRPIVI